MLVALRGALAKECGLWTVGGCGMRHLGKPPVGRYRVRNGAVVRMYGSAGDDGNGVFKVHSPYDGAPLNIVASNGAGWDHVSVSRSDRCPTWDEMDHVKGLFFDDDETVMQLHVPTADHRNLHEFCLHLWRPQDQPIPRPPSLMVAYG